MEYIWLSIDDYARTHDVSHSTIRRKIKKNAIEHKLEDGKYLLKSAPKLQDDTPPADLSMYAHYKDMQDEIKELKREIVSLQKENDDLKTLIGIYEQQRTPVVEELELERF